MLIADVQIGARYVHPARYGAPAVEVEAVALEKDPRNPRGARKVRVRLTMDRRRSAWRDEKDRIGGEEGFRTGDELLVPAHELVDGPMAAQLLAIEQSSRQAIAVTDAFVQAGYSAARTGVRVAFDLDVAEALLALARADRQDAIDAERDQLAAEGRADDAAEVDSDG